MIISWILWIAVLFRADTGISCLEDRRKHSIRGHRTNRGNLRSSIANIDKHFVQEPNKKSNSLDIGLSLLVGSPIVMEPAEQPAKEVETVAVNDSSVDSMDVYLRLLFDPTTAKNISWNLREASTNVLVASVPEQTYASQTDATELIQLIPGEIYEIEFSDSSQLLGSPTPIFTDFLLEVSEPAQEIAKGQIGPGTTTALVFEIPDGTSSNEEGDQSLPQSVSIEKNQVFASGGDNIDPGDDHSSISEAPSLTIATVVDPLDEPPTPTEISDEDSGKLCALKGTTCNTNSDCCSFRCSPQKLCFSSGLASRNRLSRLSGHGGSAADLVGSSRRRREPNRY